MSGLTHSHFFPNEDPNTENAFDLKPLSKKGEKEREHSFLLSLDDSDDFYDPFSDLNLFLSKKIKKEIEANGSLKKWSSKIEANLLAKILPEFKKNFPKYRLGASALKKVWAKVEYFYEKLLSQKGAITKSGDINLKCIIRKNVKTCSFSKDLPPYVPAHQIAVNISECIATVEGKKTKLEHLTRVIWAVQKHLIKNLPSTNAKSPYEQYNTLDKLIVKTLVEVNASSPGLNFEQLKIEILNKIKLFQKVKALLKNHELTLSLSTLLAKKLSLRSDISKPYPIERKQNIESFIRFQFKLSKTNTFLSKKSQKVELVQRLLALCSIAKSLPKNISQNCIKRCIDYLHSQALGKDITVCPVAPQSLFLFLNAQMHLMSETKTFTNLNAVYEDLFQAYSKATKLPFLSDVKYDQFEIFIWRVFDREEKILSQIDLETAQTLETEIANIFIDNPKFTFQEIIQSSLQFFKKMLDLPLSNKENPLFTETLTEKIEVWAVQNDMVCRWMYLNEKNPLFMLLLKESKNLKTDKPHDTLVDELTAKAEKMYPGLSLFEDQLRIRIWIFYKQLWYTCNRSIPAYESFLKWHIPPFSNKLSPFNIKELKEIVQNKLPYTPFNLPKSLESNFS